MSIKYDNVEIPNFVTITNVKTQVLPNLENKFLQAPRMIGAMDIGVNIGTKIISIDFTIKDNSIGFIEKSEALAEWLRVDDLKARALTLPSHPNSYYMAKPNNSIELDDGITIAKGTIEFICINPFRIDKRQMVVNGNSINYRGRIKTSPILEIKVASNTNKLSISVSNSKYNNSINLVGEFNAGDVVKIDLNEAKVYKNNVLDMSLWGLSSKSHKLVKGSNNYNVSNGSLTVKYNTMNL